MATGNSGSFTLAGSLRMSAVCYWSETYDTAANTHIVSIDRVMLVSTNWYGYNYYINGTISVGGQTVITFNSVQGSHHCYITGQNTECRILAGSSSYQDSPWTSGALTGNDDGSLSTSIAINIKGFTSDGSGASGFAVNSSQTVALYTIPRKSSVAMADTALGSAGTITITRASSAFTHTLTYAFGSATGTIVSGTTSTSVSWTPPLTLANQVPNSTTGTVTITCQTYNGSTLIGSTTTTAVLSVPASVKPTLSSVTAARVNGEVPSSWGIYVQNKSKATLKINSPAGAYGSTVSAYSISGGGFSSTASSFTTDFLTSSGSITFTAKVKDSRGRWSDAKTVSISVVAYSSPAFSDYAIQRCTSAGTVSANGTYAKGNAAFTYSACSNKNSVTTSVAYKKNSVISYTDAATTFTFGTDFVFGGGNLSVDSTYDIKLSLTDAFGTVSVVQTLSTASVLMDFKSGGTGLAIGKVSEKDKLECAWNAEFGKNVDVTNNFTAGSVSTTNLYGKKLVLYGSNDTTTTKFITASDAETVYISTKGVTPFIVTPTSISALSTDAANVTMGTSAKPWKAVYGTSVYGTNVYENGTALSSKYLPLAGGTVTGSLVLSKTTDAAGTSNNACALKIGTTTGTHLELDGDEIMAKASGTTTGPLYINHNGGDVYLSGYKAFYTTLIGNGSMSQNSTLSGTVPADTRLFIIALYDTSSGYFSMAVPASTLMTGGSNVIQLRAYSDYYSFKITFSGTTATLTKTASGTKTVYFYAVR